MSKTPMTWRYLIARELSDDGGDYFTVREVYEDSEGGLSWTAEPMWPSGETRGELTNDLSLMAGAANGPILDLTLDPPALVRPRDFVPTPEATS